jgi:hypothetical protein
MDEDKMKTVVSYVSGTGGDFIVNCCNNAWSIQCKNNGAVQSSATIRTRERDMGNSQWLNTIESIPYQYVGSHSIQRLMQLPVIPMWLVVPDQLAYSIWARRDCVTRGTLLHNHGNIFEKIKDMILSGQEICAAEFYLDWITRYNWTLMQMRIVQPTNKIDISQLLTPGGIDSVIDQIDSLKAVATQCRFYHKWWLSAQFDLSESSTLTIISKKLLNLVHNNNYELTQD